MDSHIILLNYNIVYSFPQLQESDTNLGCLCVILRNEQNYLFSPNLRNSLRF